MIEQEQGKRMREEVTDEINSLGMIIKDTGEEENAGVAI